MVTNSQRSIAISLPSAQETLEFLLGQVQKEEMAIHFIGKEKISQLHATHFDDPSPTDCITFPFDDPHFLGEVFVCPKVAQEYVKEHGGNLEDEITLYVVHGFLHLMGYEDTTPEKASTMREQEKKWMNLLTKNRLGVKIRK
ncbi:MAG: rRNA maturation RNase YbeY [Simkaniaceae bacterium]|nr:rRNA maturation RNase YbeY [Candidatus Sacchlamyda saccharinae]